MFGCFDGEDRIFWLNPCLKCGNIRPAMAQTRAMMSYESQFAYMMVMKERVPRDQMYRNIYAMNCTKCGYKQDKAYLTAREAVGAWNRRYLFVKLTRILTGVILASLIIFICRKVGIFK